MVVANNKIDGDKKIHVKRWGFLDTVVQCWAHHPMERIHGFMQSH
jgi:hypothetical protein